MKLTRWLIGLMLMNLHAPAQNNKIDSLVLVSKGSNKKEAVKALNNLVNLLVYDKPGEAKQYAFQSMKLAADIDDEPGLADAYTRIGIAYDVSGQYDSSIYYDEKALLIYNKLDAPKGRGSALNNLGLIYWNMGDYDKALDCFFKALKDFETIKNDQYTANALNNIGLVYDDLKKYNDALTFHYKAKEVYERIKDPYLQGAVYNNLGNTYSSLNKLDSAEVYFKKAIDRQLQAKDDYGLSIAYSGYGTLMEERGQRTEAQLLFEKSLALKRKLNEVSGETILLIHLANLQQEKGHRDSSALLLLEAEKLAEKNDLKKELISIYNKLADYYEQTDSKRSIGYYKKYDAVKDSVFNENSNRQITELNTKYETGKKELKLKEQDLLLARKNQLIAGIVAAVIVMLLLAFYFYKRHQFKQAQQQQQERMLQQDAATRVVMTAEENERRRIAAELHDGIGQMMSAARMNLSAFEQEVDFKTGEQKQAYDNIINLVDQSCREIRSVSHQMMPNALLKKGLTDAIREFLERIDARILKVSLHTEGLNEKLDTQTESVLYRVIQECVNNVLKHAAASTLDISMIRDADGISITVEDNGKGFDTRQLADAAGIGTENIRSRVQFLKGSVEFDSTPGRGTLVAIHVPN